MGLHKLSGITTWKRITFVGHTKKVTIRNSDGTFFISSYNNQSAKSKYDIPFIRGFVKLFNVFKMMSHTGIGKFAIFMLCFGFISLILGLFSDESSSSKMITSISDIVFLVFNITILTGLIVYVYRIRHLHGLEHRLLKTYYKGLSITSENVKEQSKETSHCGSTLLGILLMIELVWVGIFNLPEIFVWILLPSVGYELFLLSHGYKWYNKIFYVPGWLVQQITTSYKISDETIKKYISGFKSFVKQEDPDHLKYFV